VPEPSPAESIPAPSRTSLLAVTFALEVALAAVAFVAMRLTGVRPQLDAGALDVLAGASAGAVMAAGALSLIRTRARLIARLRSDFVMVIRLFERAKVPDLLLLSVLAGVAEELLFRGFLQQWLAGRVNLHVAILGTAILFGLAHAVSRSYFVFATVLAALLGYLYHITGSLPAAMLAHGLYDFLALVFGTRFYAKPHSRTTDAA